MPREINEALVRVARRAEQHSVDTLMRSFVQSGSMLTVLSSRDHQILYGRRGTGKTHALRYFGQERRRAGDIVVEIDLRSIGSTGGLYADPSISIIQRATRLLCDTLNGVHQLLLDECLAASDDDTHSLNLSVIGPILDNLADAITEVEVKGPVELSRSEHNSRSTQGSLSLTASLGDDGGSIEAGLSGSASRTLDVTKAESVTGQVVARIHFGRVSRALENIVKCIGGRHLWLLLDEWSSLPPELQPLLADLLRRAAFHIAGLTVKIAAIEQRSVFITRHGPGLGYTGVEVGADITADLNLDDFMVFDNDEHQASKFFAELFYQHICATAPEVVVSMDSPSAFIGRTFTQFPTFLELVRASEGVPRDAINILAVSAQRAQDSQIAIEHVRTAASRWYNRDKESPVKANPTAQRLLHWVIDEVIGVRKARAFLLRADVADTLVENLYDARVVHLLKRNVSSRDEPGVRYNVFKLDYGCYVDLITTVKAPQGLLFSETAGEVGGFVEVPPDDYRSIRRAILDLEAFYRKELQRVASKT